jgi:hypothetical protein
VASAGSVVVDFAAETARFTAELKKVNDRVKSVESGFKSLEKVASTALKFFSIGIATSFIRSAAEAADQLGKVADKLGISTERLTAFQLAAADAGVETGTLNKLLTDAQRRLGEAAGGTGATYDALRSLGLGVRDLQKLSPDELFLRYADSINQLKSRAEQFSVAQDLFGKSAQEAFTLIAAGRPAIEEAAATVDRLGLALSRIDIAQIEVANDKLGLLAKVSQAFGQQMAAALAPFVTEFVDRLTGVGITADETRGKLDAFARAVFFTFETLANGARAFDAAVSTAFLAFSKSQELAFAALRKSFDLTAQLDEFVGLDSLAEKFRGFSASAGEAEAFAASLSEQAAARVTNALDKIQTFGQMSAEADRIVAEAQASAEEAAARQAEISAGLTGESRIDQIQFSLDIEAEILRSSYEQMIAEQVAFEEIRATVSQQFADDAIIRSQDTQARIAAAIRALGYASVAAIAATGFAEIGQIRSSPSAGAPLGSPTNPVFTNSNSTGEQIFGAQQKSQVSIRFEGVFTAAAAREIAEQIRDVVDNSDIHIIGPNSSNARELRGD